MNEYVLPLCLQTAFSLGYDNLVNTTAIIEAVMCACEDGAFRFGEKKEERCEVPFFEEEMENLVERLTKCAS